MSRRSLMACAEALRAAALLGIPALIGLDLLTWPLLALLGFAAVSGTVAYSVAAPALVPSLVTPDALPAANARIELARTVAFAAGPALVTQFVFNVAFFVILAVFVPHAVHHLGLAASGIGVTLALFGVGMVIGALLAARILRALPFGTVIAIGPVTGLAAATIMALTVRIPSPLLAGLSFFLLGLGPILWVISTTTLRQTVTPPQLLGRVSAINVMTYGARPVGALIGALIGGLFGTEACLVAAVFGFAVQAVVILTSPVVRLARQPAMRDDPPTGHDRDAA